MRAERIARVLDEIGDLLELRGENPFRCRAYHNAADALRGLGDNLDDQIAEGRLADVPGLGAAIVAKVVQLATTGRLAEHDELLLQTPPGLFALLRVPGLGPKKVRQLHQALGIESLIDLRRAAETDAIAGVKGFGAKTQARILEGITFVESIGEQVLQSQARRLAAPIVEALRGLPGAGRAEAAGTLRRRAETVGELVFVLEASDPEAALDALAASTEGLDVQERKPGRLVARLAGGLSGELRAVRPEQFAIAWHEATGSAVHVEALRRRAEGLGLTLDGLTLTGPDGPIPVHSEADLFAAIGLPEIPPELREDGSEVELAADGALPKLIEPADLTGTFHCHTDWSDGAATLEQMAEAAMALGLKYLGIADHSRSAAYAGGLSVERVRAQWEAIDALNARFGPRFRLYKGTECDILADGSLDFPDDLLAGFDYVVASVHSLFRLPRETMTARLVRAASHPKVTMLGHPTGRLLLARAGYELDIDAVIEAAAASGTLIEINANPHRLDLSAEHARKARAAGVGIAINPDAHDTAGLLDLDYGVGVARRAGLSASDVLNAAGPEEVGRRLESLRSRRPGSHPC